MAAQPCTTHQTTVLLPAPLISGEHQCALDFMAMLNEFNFGPADLPQHPHDDLPWIIRTIYHLRGSQNALHNLAHLANSIPYARLHLLTDAARQDSAALRAAYTISIWQDMWRHGMVIAPPCSACGPATSQSCRSGIVTSSLTCQEQHAEYSSDMHTTA
jgi:hypothetical protein